MDWWSFVFIALNGSGLVYLGLALIWLFRYLFGTHAERVYFEPGLRVVVTLAAVCFLVAFVLMQLHQHEAITMWWVGYAILG